VAAGLAAVLAVGLAAVVLAGLLVGEVALGVEALWLSEQAIANPPLAVARPIKNTNFRRFTRFLRDKILY
jgi:hypothetical protein